MSYEAAQLAKLSEELAGRVEVESFFPASPADLASLPWNAGLSSQQEAEAAGYQRVPVDEAAITRAVTKSFSPAAFQSPSRPLVQLQGGGAGASGQQRSPAFLADFVAIEADKL